jgi:hypothetical protein
MTGFYITRNRDSEKLRIPGTDEILTFRTRDDALDYLNAADLASGKRGIMAPPREKN